MGKTLGEKRARSEEEKEEVEEAHQEETYQEEEYYEEQPQYPVSTKKKGNPEDEVLRNLIVKQLPMGFDEFDLKLLFESFGLMERWKLIMYPTGMSKGYGFIKYVEVASANEAMEKLHGSVATAISTGAKKIISVDYAAKEEALALLKAQGALKDPNEGGPEVLRNLMANYLDKSMTEVELREVFAPFGKLQSVRLMQVGKECISKGFGFVIFKNMSDAEEAIKQLDQTIPGDKGKKVKIGYAKYHEAMDALRYVARDKKEAKLKEKKRLALEDE